MLTNMVGGSEGISKGRTSKFLCHYYFKHFDFCGVVSNTMKRYKT